MSNRRFSPVGDKKPCKSAIYSKRGGTQAGTFAHVILALAYAEYLNPQLGIEVREIALRVYAGDVTVLDDYRRTKQEQIEADVDRIVVREEIKRNNTDLNHLLKIIGAKFSRQWGIFHNHGYEGLYGGLRENDIHDRKGLKHGQHILDHMGFDELAANMYRTSLAQRYLRKYPVETVLRACELHKKMGKRVRQDHEELGLDMPENLPTVENIKEAYKRPRRFCSH